VCVFRLSFVTQQPKSGLGFLVVEVSKPHTDTNTHTHARTHAHTTTPLNDDYLVAEAATYKTNTREEHPCFAVGFEPAIPAIKLLQTYALDDRATGIGWTVVTRV
jgi:hypothetical protein